MTQFNPAPPFRPLFFCTVLLALAFALGCGGGGGNLLPTPTPTPNPAITTAVQLRIGDLLLDPAVCFDVSLGSSVNPITITAVGGTKFRLGVSSNRLELSHMAGKMEPFGIISVPQGSYSSIDIPVIDPELTFVRAGDVPYTIQGPQQTVTVALNPPLTVGPESVILNLDIDLTKSVVTDASGNITGLDFSPSSFHLSPKTIASPGQQQDDSGEIEGVTGFVSVTTAHDFMMYAGQGESQLTFAVDSTTQYTDGLSDLASVHGQIVKVFGYTRPDGTFFAQRVQGIETGNGAELEGVIMRVTDTSPIGTSQLLLLMIQDGEGNRVNSLMVGDWFTGNTTGPPSSHWYIEQGNVDFTGLQVPGPDFPFDSATVYHGQRAELDTVDAPMLFVDKVRLQQQPIDGTVANMNSLPGGAARFDLQLPANSYLRILSGETVVHIFQQPGTNNTVGSISNGNTLCVRGLLFWTGTQFNMIARRITP